MAIGLSVTRDNFEKLKQRIELIAREESVGELYPEIKIDSIINIDEITKEMVKNLSLLEPIGEANKLPIFVFKNLKIDSIRSLTDGKHLKLSLKSNNNTFVDVIGFNLGHLADEYIIGDKVDVVGSLEINSFNGTDSIQINLKDIMKTV